MPFGQDVESKWGTCKEQTKGPRDEESCVLWAIGPCEATFMRRGACLVLRGVNNARNMSRG